MSYTETYHRPHRYTWEDMDKMRESLAAGLTEDAPDELKEEKEEAKQEKKEYLEWARSLGWHREKTSDFNLL